MSNFSAATRPILLGSCACSNHVPVVSCTPSTQHPETNPDAENHASSSNHRPDSHYPGAQCTNACTPYGRSFILYGGVFLSCPSSSSLDFRVSWILLLLALFWCGREGEGVGRGSKRMNTVCEVHNETKTKLTNTFHRGWSQTLNIPCNDN